MGKDIAIIPFDCLLWMVGVTFSFTNYILCGKVPKHRMDGEVWLTEERLVLAGRGRGGGIISDGSAPWRRLTPPVSTYTSRPGNPLSAPLLWGLL